MSYVLHHSSDYWAIRTLLDIQKIMTPHTRLIILEKFAFFPTLPPKNDPFALNPIWSALMAERKCILERPHITLKLCSIL